MAMRVRLDGEFLVREHDERVLDIAWWKYEAGNHLSILRSTACHPGHTRYGNGGRSFVINSDGTISPKLAQHLVLGAGKPTFSFVPAGSPLVCRFQQAAALAAGQQVPLTLASHPGLAVVQLHEPREAYHEWHYKALGIGPDRNAVVASRQGSMFVDRAGWYVCPSHLNIHQGNHTDLVVNRFNHPARLHEEHRKHGGKRPLDFVFHADGSVAPASAPYLRLGCSFPPLGGARPAAAAPAGRTLRGLKIESVAQTEVTLAWEQGSAQSFEVQWRKTGGAWQNFATVRRSKARVSGLDAGGAYSFRVRATGGEWSQGVSAQLSAPAPTPGRRAELRNSAAQPERDSQPEPGIDAALGGAFNTSGRSNLPPQAEPAPERSSGTDECPVCLDRARDTAFIPCGHQTCAECAGRISSARSYRCPVCRQPSSGTLRVF
uniref:RING-type domain-containing protein n=2 Tax=Pelagomonas calceolata TaxID=35677 RepID=A0A6S8SE86_9STRA